MMTESTFSGTRSVTAMFDDAAKAARAIVWLRSIGVQEGQILQAQDRAATAERAASAASPAPGKKRRSFVDSLVDFVFPDDEATAVADGLPGDGPRSVTVTDIQASMYDKVVSILNDEGKVKLDTRKSDIAGAGKITGFIGACLVDSDSGLMLASEGGGKLDLKLIASLNSDTLRAKQDEVEQLGLGLNIEDILITLDKQVHLIRPLERNRSMFVYVALDKATSNLGMARIQLKNIEANMQL